MDETREQGNTAEQNIVMSGVSEIFWSVAPLKCLGEEQRIFGAAGWVVHRSESSATESFSTVAATSSLPRGAK